MADNMRHKRAAARSRTLATSRARTETSAKRTLARQPAVADQQDAGPLSARPGTGVQPAHQLEVLGLLAVVAVAIAFANEGSVIPTVLAIAVRSAVRVARNANLCGRHLRQRRQHVRRVGKEGTE